MIIMIVVICGMSYDVFSASKHSGHTASATEATTSANNDAYQELSTMPSSQPVYSQLAH